MMRRKIAAGNWKMNGVKASLGELQAMAKVKSDCDVIICPPSTLIAAAVAVCGDIVIGGQDCHWNESGAHTGDLSAEILADTGAGAVIVGHSERRADHGEDNAMIANKTLAAWRAGLLAIVCVGETEAERDAGKALDVVGSQMAGSLPDAVTAKNTVVAYEPVWAIGTGRTPTLEDIAEVHDFMRSQLVAKFGEETGNGIRLLYGGSVKPGNAAEIFATSNVDGGLVGGASLKAADFAGIIQAAG